VLEGGEALVYIKGAAELSGVSVRTLHHYDEIGLLSPRTGNQGYRVYEQEDLIRLQQILFFRELDFPLSRIKELLNSPQFDRDEALEIQRKALLEKRERLNQMIKTIDETILETKGERKMSNEERFAGFDFSKNLYEQEAIDRWGSEAVETVKKNTEELPDNERKGLERDFNNLFHKLAKNMESGPESTETQQSVEKWYKYLNKIGNYSPQAFKGLGEMYVEDSRFLVNMEQYGEGFAAFMRKAMAVYAEKLDYNS